MYVYTHAQYFQALTEYVMSKDKKPSDRNRMVAFTIIQA